jgi:VWFA-related protein
MRTWKLVVWVIALLAASIGWTRAHAQTQPQAQQQTQGPEQPLEPTLHIGVTAVEIDAVVTDGKGHHVPNLPASDFELLQDGKPQTITAFRYVPVRPHADAAASAPPRAPVRTTAEPAVPLPASAQLHRDHTGRIMAIVIDDLSLRFADMGHVRSALSRFVDRDMRSDDAIAIVMTSRGVGRLQQFTNDKAVLKETIAGLHINLLGLDIDDPDASNLERDAVSFRQETLQAGSLGAVQNVVRGMRELPGRKSVVWVNSGLALVEQAGGNFRVARPYLMQAFEKLVDESNRSFVVIHTVDARGLINPTMPLYSAERGGPPPTQTQLAMAVERHRDSQDGPWLLAREAGGLSFTNNNDLGGAFGNALADQEGYYVLGYQPDTATFRHVANKVPEFHHITVRVKRSGLQTRARSGFIGLTDEEVRRPPRDAQERLWAAAASPFIANDIGVRVTPIFAHTKSGDLIRALLYLDGHGLTFAKSADGQYRAPIEVFATLVDGRGASVEAKMFTVMLRVPEDPNAARRESGLMYSIDVPVKMPGAYQLRVAARDVTSDRTGTAYQFVRVPNLSRSRLALSGVELQGSDAAGSPALRRFRASSTVRYAFDTYNAQIDPTNHHPALTLRLRLYRDGSLLLDGKPTPIDARPKEEDPKGSAAVAGALQLSSAITPGEYQLHLEVNDTLARGNAATARQWIDFTVAATR